MKTLGEIIEAAKSGERPDYDELRLAVCAMDGLMTFDRMAIWKLAEAEQEGKKPFMVWSAVFQRQENFDRVKRAMAKTPREYLGENYDPDSSVVQERRRASIALMDKFIDKAKSRSAQDQCDQLRAEVEALRKDAERYRWLRDDNAYFPEEQMICGGDELDAAIDAAMAAKEG